MGGGKKNECDLCGSSNHIFLFKGKDYLHNISGEFNIVKCCNCGLVFINPQPSQKELEKYYPKKYFTHNLIKNNFKEEIRKIIYKTYNKDNNLFLKLLFFPYHNLRGIPYKKNGKVLDFGCGNGRFLLDCKNIGWDVYGIEPDKKAAEIAKKTGIKMFNTLKKANFKNIFFNTITFWNSLEHLSNPIETLIEAKKNLKKNGDLIIEIPNIDSFAFRFFKYKWHNLDAPRHLYHFSFSTIKKICDRVGFKIIKIKYNSRPSQFLAPFKIKNWFITQIFKVPCFILNKLKLGDNFILYLRS